MQLPSARWMQIWIAIAPVQSLRTVASRLDALPQEPPRVADTVVTQRELSVHADPTQSPLPLHVRPPAQTPHEPPQPSSPQTRATQLRVQPVTHWPEPLHVWPVGQVPHEPPQPFDPQRRPVHDGVQGVSQWLLRHVWPVGHGP